MQCNITLPTWAGCSTVNMEDFTPVIGNDIHHFGFSLVRPWVMVSYSAYQHIWKTQKWPQDWKRSIFIPITNKGNSKECLNYRTIVLISHSSKVMLKFFRLGFSYMWISLELPGYELDLEKAEEPDQNCQHSLDHRGSKGIPGKHLLLLYWLHESLCVYHNKLWKVL